MARVRLIRYSPTEAMRFAVPIKTRHVHEGFTHIMMRIGSVAVCAVLLTSIGCAKQQTVKMPVQPKPNYARPLAEGDSALRLITDPQRVPDLAAAFANHDPTLLAALEQSLAWFAAPSSQQFFPFDEITHEHARASLSTLYDLFANSYDAQSFVADVQRSFDVYESVGYNNRGVVLFTGYYAPTFRASRTRSNRFAYPLYTRPADLVTDPVTGQPLGRRRLDDSVTPYYTRRQIDQSRMFAGKELVWLEDPLSAYIVHVNGSAKLRLTDGSLMYIGYAGKTDHPYTGLGQSMLDEGLLWSDELSLPAVRRVYEQNPKLVTDLIYRNKSYVFFAEYDGDMWPAGSLGVPVTAQRTLATDKKVYPRGGLVLVDTKAVTFGDDQRTFLEFMLDQDTGGAIQAPGRADIFMGVGASAEILAGGQYADGRLYYFFLKPEYAPSGVADANR